MAGVNCHKRRKNEMLHVIRQSGVFHHIGRSKGGIMAVLNVGERRRCISGVPGFTVSGGQRSAASRSSSAPQISMGKRVLRQAPVEVRIKVSYYRSVPLFLQGLHFQNRRQSTSSEIRGI